MNHVAIQLEIFVLQALPVLSRAVENNPKSIALWAVYLLIFYSYTTTGGKDDMFSYAVCIIIFVPALLRNIFWM